MNLDSRVPSGAIERMWDQARFEMKLVNPANKRKHTVIVVGSGLAGGSDYLWDLVRAAPQRLLALLEAEPERRFTDIIASAYGFGRFEGPSADEHAEPPKQCSLRLGQQVVAPID